MDYQFNPLTRQVFALMVALFIFAGIWQLWNALYYLRPIHTVHSTTLYEPGPYYAGGILPLEMTISRTEVCDAKVTRIWLLIATNEVKAVTTGPGGLGGVGERYVLKLPVRIPEGLEPGWYSYAPTVANICSDGLHTTYPDPTDFELLDAPLPSDGITPRSPE